MSWPWVWTTPFSGLCHLTWEMRIFMLEGKQYCMTPSEQSSAKRHSGVILALIRRIDTSCFWCALKTFTNTYSRNLTWKERACAHLSAKQFTDMVNVSTNNFLQSLTLNHLATVNILSKSPSFWRIWRCPLQNFSSCKFER